MFPTRLGRRSAPMRTNLQTLTDSILRSIRDNTGEVQHFDQSPLPEKSEIIQIIEETMVLLFPGYFGHSELSFDSIEQQIGYRVAIVFEKLQAQVYREARHSCKFEKKSCRSCEGYSSGLAEGFIEALPVLRARLELDVKAAFRNDPAASGFDEIITSYPGLEAIAVFRIANLLHRQGMRLIPRIMTEWAHTRTGVDIHPGATIGDSFFIDHGTGVVIGETTVIGNRVTLYQGVTLGALNFPRDAEGNLIRGAKRHPTIEDDAVIYAGATILGGKTVIGEGAVVGGNVWLTESVPPHCRVVMAKPDLRITSKHEEIGASVVMPAQNTPTPEKPRNTRQNDVSAGRCIGGVVCPQEAQNEDDKKEVAVNLTKREPR
ncbi:MAG: serine acetyltransferase [Candidatus Riflebacteria bacterium]|nr:serine acetyltransferase [Candidatus Riflebacteria bacterium]